MEFSEVPVPQEKMTGSQFERLVNMRCKELKTLGLASIDRYGVDARRTGVRSDGTPIIIMKKSNPDFEGPFDRTGCQTIFDAKVESGASFCLSKYVGGMSEVRRQQLAKFYERSRFGCPCFFLIHWNRRELVKRTDEAATYAFPVSEEHEFWKSVEGGEVKSIKRVDCDQYGIEVRWTLLGRRRIPLPDVLFAVHGVHGMSESGLSVRGAARWI